ncbi:uncharacterized protein LOC141795198 [Halichoeres trimaculatus]|uniref:uncharacterized protein LOC141795198 n=1 Tax=Halichoeres trimaculatus TaxID=147232 RepID=UPI003D9F4938
MSHGRNDGGNDFTCGTPEREQNAGRRRTGHTCTQDNGGAAEHSGSGAAEHSGSGAPEHSGTDSTRAQRTRQHPSTEEQTAPEHSGPDSTRAQRTRQPLNTAKHSRAPPGTAEHRRVLQTSQSPNLAEQLSIAGQSRTEKESPECYDASLQQRQSEELCLPHKLRRHSPDDAPSDALLRDQLLLGLREGPLAQALKVYARRNPDETFATIRQEALLLEAEHGNQEPEMNHQRAWKDAFATCQRVEATMAEDGLLGYVRPASRRSIQIPPKSEVLVWGRARMGPGGRDYCVLLEALPEARDVGVARTLAVVRKGRVPVRVCNPHPYSMSIGRFQKLGKLYHVDEADVHGPRDLSLSLDDDCVVEVAVVDTTAGQEKQELPKELSELTNRSDLSKQQQEELRTLLLKWSGVFARHDEDFGRTDLVQHQIHTGDAAPVRERYRPLPPSMYKEMKTLLAGMLEKGVIRESCSPWAAPIVLVRKKDGSWRFCVDYRKLNAVTHKDAFPLPRIEETLTSLTRAEWFSTLDLASGYWQVEMDPKHQEKTAFTTPLGLFEFERMPFGLCNAPATFQRLMQQCLSGQLAESLLVYLDDIIIYSPDFSSHLQHLDELFQKLWRHGLKLRLDKCKLLQHEVKFLGHVVDPDGVRPDPDKISAVLDWPIPSTIRQVQAFLGLAGYYRRFVSGFAKVARPLNQLLTGIPADKRSEARQVQWTSECQESFDALKKALTEAPVLAFANYSLPFIVYTDASNQGLGAVLAQVQDGRERVIAYASRSLHPTERNDANYSSFKLELLALKWAVTEKFKDYLTGARFTVFTDNNPVAHLQTARLGAVEQRWVSQLASFDYVIQYRSGRSNVNADALSRRPASSIPAEAPDGGSELIKAPTIAAVELAPEGGNEDLASHDWEEAQAHDQDIQVVKKYVETRVMPEGPERQVLSHRAKRLMRQWKKLEVKGNLLCRKVIDQHTHEVHLQIVCPRTRCEEVWRRIHEAAAHAGVDRTLARLRLRFYWPDMERENLTTPRDAQ